MAVRHLLRLALAAACALGHPWLPGADTRIGDGAASGGRR